MPGGVQKAKPQHGITTSNQGGTCEILFTKPAGAPAGSARMPRATQGRRWNAAAPVAQNPTARLAHVIPTEAHHLGLVKGDAPPGDGQQGAHGNPVLLGVPQLYAVVPPRVARLRIIHLFLQHLCGTPR